MLVFLCIGQGADQINQLRLSSTTFLTIVFSKQVYSSAVIKTLFLFEKIKYIYTHNNIYDN